MINRYFPGDTLACSSCGAVFVETAHGGGVILCSDCRAKEMAANHLFVGSASMTPEVAAFLERERCSRSVLGIPVRFDVTVPEGMIVLNPATMAEIEWSAVLVEHKG